jgi:hypothetical protein
MSFDHDTVHGQQHDPRPIGQLCPINGILQRQLQYRHGLRAEMST